MVDKLALKIKMLKYGDSNKSLAAALGKTPSTICCKLKGSQRFTLSEMQTIIDRYGLTPEETQSIFFASEVSKMETNGN